MYKLLPVTMAAGLFCVVSSTVLAASGNIDQRLTRLENLLTSQVLMEQMQQMEQVRQELSELRALLESQENQFVMIKQRQRNLYQDMDRRLHDLEVGASTSTTKPTAVYTPVVPPSSGSNVALPINSKLPVGKPTTVTEVDDKDGKQTYNRIYKTLKEGNYQQAIIDFDQFIKKYPESSYTDNAYYWMGEAYFLSRNNAMALKAFQKIVSDFPSGNKIKDAKLKIGYTYFEMKDWASSKVALEKVVSDYPGETVAINAKRRLQRIQRENR